MLKTSKKLLQSYNSSSKLTSFRSNSLASFGQYSSVQQKYNQQLFQQQHNKQQQSLCLSYCQKYLFGAKKKSSKTAQLNSEQDQESKQIKQQQKSPKASKSKNMNNVKVPIENEDIFGVNMQQEEEKSQINFEEETFDEAEELKNQYNLIESDEHFDFSIVSQRDIDSGGESDYNDEYKSDSEKEMKKLKSQKKQQKKKLSNNNQNDFDESLLSFKLDKNPEKNAQHLYKFVIGAKEKLSEESVNKILVLTQMYRDRISSNNYSGHIHNYQKGLLIGVNKVFKKDCAEELGKMFVKCQINDLNRNLFYNISVVDIDNQQEIIRKKSIYNQQTLESVPLPKSNINELEEKYGFSEQQEYEMYKQKMCQLQWDNKSNLEQYEKSYDYFNKTQWDLEQQDQHSEQLTQKLHNHDYNFGQRNQQNFEKIQTFNNQQDQVALVNATKKMNSHFHHHDSQQQKKYSDEDLCINDHHNEQVDNSSYKLKDLISENKVEQQNIDISAQKTFRDDEDNVYTLNEDQDEELQDQYLYNQTSLNSMGQKSGNKYNINLTDIIEKGQNDQIEKIHEAKRSILQTNNYQLPEEDIILYQQNFNLRNIQRTSKVYCFGFKYDTKQNPHLINDIQAAVEKGFGIVKDIKLYNYREFMTGFGDALETREQKLIEMQQTDLEEYMAQGKKIKKKKQIISKMSVADSAETKHARQTQQILKKVEESKILKYNKSYAIIELNDRQGKKEILGDDMRAFGMRIGNTNKIKFEDADFKTSILIRNIPYGIQVYDFINFFNDLCDNNDQIKLKIQWDKQINKMQITKDYLIIRFKNFEESILAIDLIHKKKFQKQVLRSHHFYGNLIPQDNYNIVKEEYEEEEYNDVEYRENFQQLGNTFLMKKVKDHRIDVQKEINNMPEQPPIYQLNQQNNMYHNDDQDQEDQNNYEQQVEQQYQQYGSRMDYYNNEEEIFPHEEEEYYKKSSDEEKEFVKDHY